MPTLPSSSGTTYRTDPYGEIPGLGQSPFTETEEPGVLVAHAYSGVDIKVVVHLPREEVDPADTELGEQEQSYRELESALENAENEEERAAIAEDLNTISQSIQALRENTPENRAITKTLAEVQTLSLSVYRDKVPVKTLGASYPRSITRGPRCLPASEKVLVKDRGLISIAEVRPGDYVQSSPVSFNKVKGSWLEGYKPCCKVRVGDGYTLNASTDHPVLTPSGWRTAGDLKPGDEVLVSAMAPCEEEDCDIDDNLLKVLAYLIGDGRHSHQKKIPDRLVSGMSDRQIRLFLNRLFSTDGCYSISSDRKYIEAKYSSTSEELIDQIRVLLNKVGIKSLKHQSKKAGDIGGRSGIISRHDAYTLVISSAFDLVRFVRGVGIFGKDERILSLQPLLISRIRDHYVPLSRKDVRQLLKPVLQEQGRPLKQFGNRYDLYAQRPLSIRSVCQIIDDVDSPEISSTLSECIERALDTPDQVVVRKVFEVSRGLTLPVYDLEVEKRHSFISSNLILHNTIAGTMVFTHFHRHLFDDFLGQASYRSTGVGDWDNYRWTSFVPDQLPPMDISIVFANEYGNISWMGILGVEFMNEGMTMSIEDLFVEGTIQYIARDFDPIRNVANRPSTRTHGVGQTLTGSGLVLEEYASRIRGRRNPFV